MKKVLFIASTGGHLNELMQLKDMFNYYDYMHYGSYILCQSKISCTKGI